MPRQRHRHGWDSDDTGGGGSTGAGRGGCHRGVGIRGRRAPRLVSPYGPGLTNRDHLARAPGGGPGKCPGDRGRRHRRCAGSGRRAGSRRRGSPDGNCLPGLRRIRRQPAASRRSDATRGRAHRSDPGVQRKTRAGHSQSIARGAESFGNRDPALSAAAGPGQKSLGGGGGSGPIGSSAALGRPKRDALPVDRRICIPEPHW